MWSDQDQLELAIKLATDIIGKSYKSAEIILQNSFIRYRVVKKDKTPYIITMDYCPDRVNITLVKDIVTETTLG